MATKQLPIRLDDTQRELIDLAASRANMTPTEYIRAKALEAALSDLKQALQAKDRLSDLDLHPSTLMFLGDVRKRNET